MNRAERRRLEKQGKKNPTVTIKASELDAMKQKERQKASAGFCRRFAGSV